MSHLLAEQLEESAAAIREQWPHSPLVGLVLGSGLAQFVDKLSIEAEFTSHNLPHYPTSTAMGHRGRFLCARLSDVPVVIMDGRQHSYEGHGLADVVYPVRLMAHLGIRALVLSNASGGVNPRLQTGDVVLLDDHINMMWDNPLIGPNDDRIGPRFPDMCAPYDPRLAEVAVAAIAANGARAHRGVYLAQQGPCYETPAEYRMARQMGADVVGMSTVPETLAAVHQGLAVTALSVVSNVFISDAPESTTGEDVIAAVSRSVPHVFSAVEAVVRHVADNGAAAS